MVYPPLTSQIFSLTPVSLSFSAPATLATLLFPRYPNYIPTTWPLHMQDPLLGMPFTQIPEWAAPFLRLFSGFKYHLSREVL